MISLCRYKKCRLVNEFFQACKKIFNLLLCRKFYLAASSSDWSKDTKFFAKIIFFSYMQYFYKCIFFSKSNWKLVYDYNYFIFFVASKKWLHVNIEIRVVNLKIRYKWDLFNFFLLSNFHIFFIMVNDRLRGRNS